MDPSQLCTSPFVAGDVALSLAMPPSYIGVPDQAAHQALQDLTLKYHAGLGGVLMSFAKLRWDKRAGYSASHSGIAVGRIVDELPVVHTHVRAQVLLFKPALGTVIKAKVRSIGAGFIGCLVAGLFQGSVVQDDMAGGYTYVEEGEGEGEAAGGAGATAGSGAGADAVNAGSGYWKATSAHAQAVAAAKLAGGSAAAALRSSASSSSSAGGAGHKRKREEDAGSSGSSSSGVSLSFNRILACNPSAIRVGDVIAFRLTSLEYSPTGLGLHGSFVDDAAVPLPLPTAGAAGGAAAASSGGAGGKAAGGKHAAAAEDEEADEPSVKKARKEKKEKKEKKDKKEQ